MCATLINKSVHYSENQDSKFEIQYLKFKIRMVVELYVKKINTQYICIIVNTTKSSNQDPPFNGTYAH